jgi:hypothetical protein
MGFSKTAIEALLWLRVGLQLVLLLTLWRRRSLRKYAAFSAYLTAEILTASCTYLLLAAGDRLYTLYFNFYWAAFGLALVLRAAVVREVLLGVFARHERLKSVASTLWSWGVVVLLLVGLVGIKLLPGTEYTQLVNGLFVVARLVNGVQFGLMLVLLGMALTLALPWRNLYFGVALGFGLYAAASLAGFTLHTVGASLTTDVLSWIEVTGYLLAVLVWAGFLWVREPVLVSEAPQEFGLDQWNQELGRILNK